MKLPTQDECFRIIREMNMMDHIIDHSVMVSNVALCLGRHLKKQNPLIDIELTRSAALLHDITKTRSFDTGEMHSKTGGILLEEMGYPEVADIVRQHVILDIYMEDAPVSEHEIVNYADKRVLHDQVVSLDRRLKYIKVKYGAKKEFQSKLQAMWDMTLELEIKLFRHLPFLPSQLSEKVIPNIRKKPFPCI